MASEILFNTLSPADSSKKGLSFDLKIKIFIAKGEILLQSEHIEHNQGNNPLATYNALLHVLIELSISEREDSHGIESASLLRTGLVSWSFTAI